MATIINDLEYNGPGIYAIKGINNDYIYVGSARRVAERIQQHKAAMANGGQSKGIRRVLNETDEFEAILLEEVPGSLSKYFLHDREYHYATELGAFGENGLNSAPIPFHHSPGPTQFLDDRHGIHEGIANLIFCAKKIDEKLEHPCYGADYKRHLLEVEESHMRCALQDMLKYLDPIDGHTNTK